MPQRRRILARRPAAESLRYRIDRCTFSRGTSSGLSAFHPRARPVREQGMRTILQSLWVGPSLGPLQAISIESFLRQGAEFHLYCFERPAGVPEGTLLRDAAEILPASAVFTYRRGPGRGSVSAFSNLFRYKLLAERGGWWVDSDVFCLKAFPRQEAVVLAGAPARQGFRVATAVMRLPAGHPIAVACWKKAARRSPRKLRWGEIGPDLLTHVVEEMGLQQRVHPPEVFCPVPWWEWECFRAPDLSECAAYLTPRTRSIHLCNEMWRRAGAAPSESLDRGLRSLAAAPPGSDALEMRA